MIWVLLAKPGDFSTIIDESVAAPGQVIAIKTARPENFVTNTQPFTPYSIARYEGITYDLSKSIQNYFSEVPALYPISSLQHTIFFITADKYPCHFFLSNVTNVPHSGQQQYY